MEQTASARIAELIKHHDDLDKVSSLRSKLQKEKAVIDSQLKAGVQAQTHVTTQGAQSLADAKVSLDAMREELIRIDKLRVESEESVQDFDKINRLSKILENFEKTQTFLNNFKTMSSELTVINGLMEEDGDPDLDNPMNNILEAHYRLSLLRDVEDSAWHYAQSSTDDVRRTISKHFGPLDQTVANFDRRIEWVAEGLLELLRSDNASLVVRVAKIIDREEKQDLASEMASEIAQTSSMNTANLLGSLQNMTSHRRTRGYPAKFFDAAKRSVEDTYKYCIDTYGEDVDELLDNLEWIFNDLGLVQEGLVKCFPQRWRVFDKFVQYYHYESYKLYNHVLDTDPPAATILHILDSVRDYYEKMGQMGVSKEDLKPPLLDGRENALYDDYLSLIVSKLREWKTNLSTTEKENFIERAVPPETDSDNRLGMQGEVVMFSIINQQIDVAADSGLGRILAGCVDECSNVLLERQKEWEKVMKEQVDLQINDTGVDDGTSTVPGGLVEYLIALANDQIKGADYTEAISSRVAPVVSKKYRTQISSRLDQVSDEFINLAKKCITGLISIIFNDLVTPFKEIFTSSVWYKGRPTRQIVDTILEYIVDCHSSLNPIIFEVFADDLLEELILQYLNALAPSSLKVPKGSDQIKNDIEQFYNLFVGQDVEYVSPEHVQSQFKVFEHLLATLDCTVAELPERFQALREDFWDAPLDLFEKMVRARKDIEGKVVKEIMSSIRTEVLQTQQAPDAGSVSQSTYLSRFTTLSSPQRSTKRRK